MKFLAIKFVKMKFVEMKSVTKPLCFLCVLCASVVNMI